MNRSTLLTATALVLILSVGGRPVGAETVGMAFPIAGLPTVAGGAAPATARPEAAAPDAFAFEILEAEEAPRAPQAAQRPAERAGTPITTATAAPVAVPVAALGRIEPRARNAQPLWTSTGIADLTLGRDLEEGRGWSEGRAAFFAEGPLRNGWTLTISADTGARPLDEVFDGLGGTAPRDALERLRADPGAVTFGDESVMLGTGGSDGRPYARIAREGSHLTLGQGRVSLAEGDLIRADRSIYGLSGRLSGRRGTVEGFASSEESIPQTDEFAATGGASYRLSHRDILPGTTQLSVERRDENGRLLERRRLVEGVDYRVNHTQGHVLLDRPLVETPTGALFVGEADELVLRADYARPAQGIEDSVAGLRARHEIGAGLSLVATTLRDGSGDAADTVTGPGPLRHCGDRPLRRARPCGRGLAGWRAQLHHSRGGRRPHPGRCLADRGRGGAGTADGPRGPRHRLGRAARGGLCRRRRPARRGGGAQRPRGRDRDRERHPARLRRRADPSRRHRERRAARHAVPRRRLPQRGATGQHS